MTPFAAELVTLQQRRCRGSDAAILLRVCPTVGIVDDRYEQGSPARAKTRRTLMPFLLHLAESGLSKGTIQNHVDNVWLLGGEGLLRRDGSSGFTAIGFWGLFRAMIFIALGMCAAGAGSDA